MALIWKFSHSFFFLLSYPLFITWHKSDPNYESEELQQLVSTWRLSNVACLVSASLGESPGVLVTWLFRMCNQPRLKWHHRSELPWDFANLQCRICQGKWNHHLLFNAPIPTAPAPQARSLCFLGALLLCQRGTWYSFSFWYRKVS